jgi:hypothetical protein
LHGKEEKSSGTSIQHSSISGLPSFEVQFKRPQVNILSIKCPPFKNFLSLVFKSTVPQRNLKSGFHCTYKIFVRKPEGKRPLGRPTHIWKNDIKRDLKERGWYGLD